MQYSQIFLILILYYYNQPAVSFQAIRTTTSKQVCSVGSSRLVWVRETTKSSDFEQEINIHSTWNSFLQSLWKGVTLPFPALRKLQSSHGRSHIISFGMSLREGFLYLLAYLTTGVFAYSVVLEKWSVIDALYFSCVTFSTVGYGDLCPTTPQSKLFTCVFGLCGIAFLGAAIATISGRVIQAEVEAVHEARKRSKERLTKLFEGMPTVLKRHRHKNRVEQRQALKKAETRTQRMLLEYKAGRRWVQTAAQAVQRVLPSLSIIFGGSALVHYLNGHSQWFSLDSIYLGIITASTIGFGDFSPQTKWARLMAVVYIPLAVAAAGDLFSGLANALVVRRQREIFARQLETDLTIKHLQAMDVDGDGKITREEYVQFMLIEMGLVSAGEFEELAEQFDRLDVTRSGYLDNDDLKLMAELRGATVKDLLGNDETDQSAVEEGLAP